MKSIIYALALGTALATGAQAADVYQRGGSTKDGPDAFDAPTQFRWSGIYIGGSVGYGNANHDLSLKQYHSGYCFDQFGNQLSGEPEVNSTVAPADTFDPGSGEVRGKPFGFNAEGTCANSESESGPTGGIRADDSIAISGASREVAHLDGLNSHGIVGDVRLGVDQQVGRFVFGVFGSYGLSQMESSGSIGVGDDALSFGVEKGDEWSLGARAGILVNPRTLAYILAAYTETEYDFSIAGGDERGSRTVDFSGITVGGGVEFALTQNIFFGIEGTHTFYDSETLFDSGVLVEGDPTGQGFRLDDELGETKVMGTLKIKLNTGLGAGFLD